MRLWCSANEIIDVGILARLSGWSVSTEPRLCASLSPHLDIDLYETMFVSCIMPRGCSAEWRRWKLVQHQYNCSTDLCQGKEGMELFHIQDSITSEGAWVPFVPHSIDCMYESSFSVNYHTLKVTEGYDRYSFYCVSETMKFVILNMWCHLQNKYI